MQSFMLSRPAVVGVVAGAILLVFVAAHFVNAAPGGAVTVESASGAAPSAATSEAGADAPDLLGAAGSDSSGASDETAAPTVVVVDVAGAVRRPGLYRLPHGSRIADAIARAGGATRNAESSLVNLAAPLADGEQVLVPSAVGGAAATATPTVDGSTPSPTAPINLNAATAEQLDGLPGVGPVTAQKIIDYRTEHGSFTSVDDLDAIPGIGPARLAQLRDLVTA